MANNGLEMILRMHSVDYSQELSEIFFIFCVLGYFYVLSARIPKKEKDS